MAFEAIIFTPSQKERKHLIEKIYWISIFVMLCALSILLIFKISNLLESILKIIACICAIINFIFIPITSFYSYQVLNGKLEGQLIIDEMNIDINGKIINVQEIKSAVFSLDDRFEDQGDWSNISPSISQGVNNFILIKTKEGKEHEVFFRIDRFMNKKELNPFIAQLIKHKAVPFERGIELMKLKTKEEIEELRNIILQ